MPVTQFRDLTLHYTDENELKTLLDEIWRKRTYYVDLATNTPVIMDAGAHIGLTTLYLHSLYPQAHFICIEPNPQNIPLLTANLAENGVNDVVIIPKALSANTGKVKLFTNPQWTVFSSLKGGGWTGEETGEFVEVETVTLSSLLTQPLDLLKMDIEGEETAVIREAQHQLKLVKHLILEFHKTKTHSEDLILRILRKNFASVEMTVDERRERTRTNRLLLIEAV